jgi:hypothetical protein
MTLPTTVVDAAGVSPADLPVLELQQYTQGTVTADLKVAGVPYAITTGYTVTLIAVETRKAVPSAAYFNKNCTVVDGPAGTVSVTFAPAELDKVGIWLGQFTVSTDADVPVHRFPCYVEVEPTLTSEQVDGPLTVAEIRMSIRDRISDDNFMLDNVEFSNSEILAAIRRPVDWWNESVPTGFPTYSYTTFPYRYYWLTGTTGELFRMAGYNLLRNRLPTSGTGLNTDDKARAADYNQLGDKLIKEWQIWARQKVRQLNAAQWLGSTKLASFGR